MILLSLIERLMAPAGPRKPFLSWLLHLQINIFFSFALGLFTVGSLVLCTAAARRLHLQLGIFDLRWGDASHPLILLGSMWFAMILGDFFFYWYHRFLHKNEFFWQHHKMHHSDRELEAISTTRQNWFEVIITSVSVTAPMAILFKLSSADLWNEGALAGMTSAALLAILQAGHMNVRLQGRWTSLLWCTPQVHRIHHSLEPKHFDKNFAFIFPVWDLLFGTYYHPRVGEFPATGVAGEDGFSSFWESQTYTQREWYKFIRARSQRR